MFLREARPVRALFGISAKIAADTRVMAANRGLCTGFLVAGLILALLAVPAGA
ncbi:DUF1304 domain-containing protein [Rhodobacter sp. M37P]|uniref:DUF1304 domain-containing protein n=2 Tax=Rhodobacter calidifons TaxID=2715277 RepID=A0ABX0G8K1_9RHOB|nr:DUF1304 domain-containing protein [Rhodobacter calidifons]